MIDLKAAALAMAGDEAGRLRPDDVERALDLALLRYGADRPRIRAAVLAVQQDGESLYLPEADASDDAWAGWEDGVNRVLELELPMGRIRPRILPPSAWVLYSGLDGERIVLRNKVPPDTRAVIRYTIKHTPASIQGEDLEAVAHWAAGLMLEQLATLHSGDRQGNLNADSVEHSSKGQNYANRAAAQRQQYLDHLGLNPKRTVAAGRVLAMGGGRLLHHGPALRPISDWRQ